MPKHSKIPTLSVSFAPSEQAWPITCKSALRTFLKQAYPMLPNVPNKASIGISLSYNDIVQQYNKQYRGLDKPTNILSFPQQSEVGAGMVYLGDLMVAYETLQSEAQLQAKNFNHHLYHIMLHGVLHCLDYTHDNDDDAYIMEQQEIKILQSFQIPNPYV